MATNISKTKKRTNRSTIYSDLMLYQSLYLDQQKQIKTLERSNASLRGHLRKTKDELKSLKILM